MNRARRFLVTLIVLCVAALPLRAAQDMAQERDPQKWEPVLRKDHAQTKRLRGRSDSIGSDRTLERGTAITDPYALRELDGGGLGLGRMLWPERSADFPLTDADLFGLSSMKPVREVLEREFESYVARHKAKFPNESIGVGETFAFQLFDPALLDSPNTRFVLAGIVNRMDRAYVSEQGCGEIRLIYRLTRITASQGEGASPRLPMTLNLVLKARDPDRTDHTITCSEIARRWLATADLSLTGSALAQRLLAADGPLELIDHRNVERIETNVQIAHAPKSAVRDFRTDYLLKVFDYNPRTRRFEEATLENQIDRDRILADDNLKREFRTWLLEPEHFRELDRGTILISEKFLARRAIVPTPVGFAISDLQPEFGLMQGESKASNAVFNDSDVVAALKKAAERGVTLENIRSVAGFERRMNDITCAGCHQTRGIGGFHFPGVDWMAEKPSNSVVVPASPHFFGDQVRRRDILAAFRDGRRPDFSRGFSSRPQTRGSNELAGTEYQDGWGAHCYSRRPGSTDNDSSFRSWGCAEGLACQVADSSSRMGMCFVNAR